MQEFKGYVFKISGGQDKQGFPMKQGVLTNGRVFLLMKPGDTCFRGFGRRKVGLLAPVRIDNSLQGLLMCL